MNVAVGPLSTSPRTSGETATTGAAVSRSASRRPGIASIGPIEMTGLDGPMITARASRSAASTSGDGTAAAAPPNSTSSTGAGAPARIM